MPISTLMKSGNTSPPTTSTPPTAPLISGTGARHGCRASSSHAECGYFPSWLRTCSPSRRRCRAWGRSVRSSWLRSPLPVCLLAIKHAGDLQVLTLVAEEHPVVLGAKADQGRFDAVKLPSVSLPSLSVAGQCL